MIGAEYAQYSSYIPAASGAGSRLLPTNLLPTFSVPHPWPLNKFNKAGFEDDFIMVAEFSEIEGPKPVMVIPEDGGHNFDKNTFSVKIMAVDHQTNSIGFSISEDTQVVISEGKDGVYSFVHHFVLYDNEARGFVRPFCMAYVTTDSRKIMTFYEELSSQFIKAARFLKYGNRMVFVRDLDRYLQDLEYSKGQLRMSDVSASDTEAAVEDRHEEEEQKYHDLQNIRVTMAEVKDILSIMKPLLNDRRVEGRFETLEQRACQQRMKLDSSNVDTISLKETSSSDRNPEATFRCGSLNESSESALTFYENRSYKPKIIPANRRKKFDCALRGLHELCSWGAKEGLKKLRCIHEHYRRDTMVLEIERSESNLLDPPGSLMTCGRCLTSNFLTGISMRGLDLSLSLAGTPLSTPGIEILRKWPSNDTLDSFKSVGSFVSLDNDDDLASLMSADSASNASEPQVLSFPISPTTMPDKPSLYRHGSSVDSESASSVYHTDEAPSASDSLNSPMQNGKYVPPSSPIPQSPTRPHRSSESDSGIGNRISHGDEQESVSQSPQDFSFLGSKQKLYSRQISGDTTCSEYSISPGQYVNCSDRHCGSPPERPATLQYSQQISAGSSQEDSSGDAHPSSGDELGPTSASSTPPRKPRAGLYSLGDLVEKMVPGVPGYGIVDVLLSCDNLQHVLYSLLTGRTVLVVATPKLEGEVTKMVTALSVFLPDHRRKHSSVIEWLSKPLKLTDLARVKLAGVCRPNRRSLKSVVPNVVKKYSTLIDLDRQIISAPKYQGTLLTNVINKRKVFNTDAEFVSFIHCWLMEISSKAFIFYHSFCLGTAGSIMYDYSLQRQKDQYQNTVRSFIAKLGLGDYDIQIVEYLAEVVKISEIDPHLRQGHDGGCAARPISLSYLPCQIHQLRY